MELKRDYKRTEVGVIPEDWGLLTLKSLVDGSRGIRYGIVQPGKYDPKGRYMVRGQDYSRGWVDPAELFRVSATVEEPFANARIRHRDILITIVGASTGKVAIVPQWLDGANLTQTTARIAVNETKANNAYCGHVLSSWFGVQQVQNYIKGGAQPGLNCCDLEKFLIPLPPTKAEQKAIAEALGDVDGLIAKLDALIAKKRDLKQAAMQQLLTGQTRLPGFSGEWEVKRIDIFAPLQRGFDLPTSQIIKGDYPVVYSNGVQNRHVQFMVKGPGVVTGRSGTIGSVHFVEQDFWPHNTSLWVTDFRGNEPRFVFYLLTSVGLEKFGTGSGVPTFNRNDVHEFRVCVPTSPAEQTAIATILSDMDAEIATLEARRDKTRALKQGMMQELLTGRIRLV
jgi:type I restriction enzyme S subunit